MAFYLVVLVTVLTHTSFKGSKVLISLYAIEFGATPLEIGILFATYSAFPVFLSVYAGKVSDRLGFRAPMLFGACGLMAGLLLPFFMPRLGMLYASAVLIGMCYIFYTVTVQHLIGSFAEGHARTRNYSLFSLGVALTTLAGPMTAGFAIDMIGHRWTYLLLAALPALPIAALAAFPGFLPRREARREARHDHRLSDLVRNRPLRRALVTSGLVETGLELVNFFVPIYGHSIGLSATQIGLCMGAFAAALLLVRLLMPALARRSSEEHVLGGSLLLAGAACLIFPFVADFRLLMVVAFLLGLGLGCGSPLSMILAYNRAPPGRSGEAMGLRQTVNKATEVVMPLVFGVFSTLAGMTPVFWMNALMLAAGAALMRRDLRIAARKAAAGAGGKSATP
jgi:MFS family permease